MLIDLLDFDHFNNLAELDIIEKAIETEIIDEATINESVKDEILIKDIKVSKVQFNTKCFEVFYSDKPSQYIFYLMIINETRYTPERLLYVACRNSIHNNILLNASFIT